jgi:hypothetical protein
MIGSREKPRKKTAPQPSPDGVPSLCIRRADRLWEKGKGEGRRGGGERAHLHDRVINRAADRDVLNQERAKEGHGQGQGKRQGQKTRARGREQWGHKAI